MSYASFEETIPKGEYGGGTVMLWDWGTWTPDPRKDPRKTIEEGHLHFTLAGHRMNGEWIMFRLKPRAGDRSENWILRKVNDEQAGSSLGLTEKYLTSIKTGRTMQEIAAAKKAKELKGWRKPAPEFPSTSSPRRRGSSADSPPPRSLDSRFRGNDGKKKASVKIPAFRPP